jgi:hypothetical protein
MRFKITAAVTALAIAAASVFAVAPASARDWRHGRHHGGGGGAIAGFAAGALLGGVLASQRPYYGNGYYNQGYGGGDAVGYCLSRFQSYDPASGTYLGYDGYRHACP